MLNKCSGHRARGDVHTWHKCPSLSPRYAPGASWVLPAEEAFPGAHSGHRHVRERRGKRRKQTRYLHAEERQEDSQPLFPAGAPPPPQSGTDLEFVLTAYRANENREGTRSPTTENRAVFGEGIATEQAVCVRVQTGVYVHADVCTHGLCGVEGVQGWESRVQFFKVTHSVWRHLRGPSFLSCEMGALQLCSPGRGGLTEGKAGRSW